MDTRTDNKESEMEKAEGSRENVNLGTPSPKNLGGDAGAPMERGAGQPSQPDKPLPDPGGRKQQGDLPKGYPSKDSDDAGGITNRPLHQEEENQRAVPSRGNTKNE